MRRRKWLLSALGSTLTFSHTPSRSQTGGQRYRIAGITPIARSAVHWVAFLDELKREGFIEGTNLDVVGFSIPAERLEAIAADLAKLGIDVIVSGGTGPTRAAQKATTSIPVITALDDFVGQGFVTSIARPGGNVTGVSIFGPELDQKRQELLLDLLPGAKRIGVLLDPASTPPHEAGKLQEAGKGRDIELTLFRAGARDEIGPAIRAARAAGAEALNVLASQFFNVNRAGILLEVGNAGLPAIYQWPEWCLEGALVAYGPRFVTVYRQIARQVAKVLRGSSPGELPVEQPTKFDLAINLKTAKSLGLVVPLALLAVADEVIERPFTAAVHASAHLGSGGREASDTVV